MPHSDKTFTEKRDALRVLLEYPCSVQLQIRGGECLRAQIHDISCNGVKLILPDNCGATVVPGNAPVHLFDVPTVLEYLENVDGHVVWVVSGICGISFQHPLAVTEQELQAAVGALMGTNTLL